MPSLVASASASEAVDGSAPSGPIIEFELKALRSEIAKGIKTPFMAIRVLTFHVKPRR